MLWHSLLLLALGQPRIVAPPPTATRTDEVTLGNVYLERLEGAHTEKHLVGDRIALPANVAFRLTFVPESDVRDRVERVAWREIGRAHV